MNDTQNTTCQEHGHLFKLELGGGKCLTCGEAQGCGTEIYSITNYADGVTTLYIDLTDSEAELLERVARMLNANGEAYSPTLVVEKEVMK